MFKSRLFNILPLVLVFSLSARAEIINFYTTTLDGKIKANEPDFDEEVTSITTAVDNLGVAKVHVNIIIVPTSDNASFDSGHNVEIPRTMEFASSDWGGEPIYKTTIDALSVYAHEYGHAVFDTYISAGIPAYSEIKRIRNAMSDLEVAALKENLSADDLAKIKKQSKDLYDSMINNKELMRLNGVTMAYHEVFADTVAVFVTNDKTSISEALFNPAVPIWNSNAKEGWESRDFSRPRDPDKWTSDEVHMLFSPLRSTIGSDACWPKDNADKTKKLKFLAQILMDDMKAKRAKIE